MQEVRRGGFSYSVSNILKGIEKNNGLISFFFFFFFKRTDFLGKIDSGIAFFLEFLDLTFGSLRQAGIGFNNSL